jgi:phage tail protein X
VSKKIVREVAEDMGLTQEQLPRSDDTPGYGGETTASDGYQADRIVIGYARNYTKRDSGETKNERPEKTGSTLMYGGNTKRNTKRSLTSFVKFAALAASILVIIFLVQYRQWFSSQDKQVASNEKPAISMENPPKKEGLSKEEKPPLQNTLIIEEKPSRDNRDKINKNETSSSTIKNLESIDPNTNSTKFAVVKRGDTIQKIIISEYGRYDDALVKLLLRANPEISDVNMIFIGQRIILPKP